ncbi:bacteriophage protein [Mycobacteroides abscessus subsp. abscessus]|nr:bacteriophage protein [Mycobacteroides abscessus subsp. abscessus]
MSHVEPFPRDKDTTPTARDHRDRHQTALWHALALGRINGRASDELDRIRNALATTIRDMCKTRGLDVPRLSSTASMAIWLRNHAFVVAHQDDGAHICDEIERMCRNIVRIVNRPPEPMTLGPCITDPAPDEVLAERSCNGDNSTRCGYALMAPSHRSSIVCPSATPRIRWPTCWPVTSASSTTAMRPCASSST